jgi:two-component system, sensor histidine kinase
VRLVDDLLDVSRITTGKLTVRRTPMDLQDAVADAVELSRPIIESRGHSFSARLVPGTVPVEGDRARLAQVLSNLLNNAAKYTNPGGRIELAVEVTESHAIVRVRDNGIGLAGESLSRIFDMFVQVDRRLERSQAGLGVGLSLARRFVELHDGSIEAHSEGEGMGSEFEVKLPLSGVRVDVPDRSPVSDNAEARLRRILLADDNIDFATSLGALLKAKGHDVKVVHDGAEALKAAAEFRPEIAFLDIGMPHVHGYEVARRMRQSSETARCVLIAVTGWGQESDRKRAREAGFDRHLTKPVDPNEIQKILEGA